MSSTILIADPDVEVVRSLRAAFKGDHDVISVKDGSKALEQSILRHPDIILFDRHCPLIGATQFLRILRANPRTEEIPIIVLSDTPVAVGAVPGFLQGVLVKPLNLDEVRAHVSAVLRKLEAVKQVGAEDGSVSGSLEQISMADLLQIFSMNRRSGCLQLVSPARESAEVYVHEGRIEEASVVGTHGDKALFRLLGWRGGRFTFIPGRRAAAASLSGTTDSLLMEGMRQADELERLRPELPSDAAGLERLVEADALPEGLHPVTAEIVGLVEFYPRVGDVVDKAKATDLEVYQALRALLSAGLLRAVEEGRAASGEALLSQDEVVELRGRLRRAGLAPTYLTCPKIALVIPEPSLLKELAVSLSRLAGFKSADLEQLYRLGMGPVGSLELDGQLSIELYGVGKEERLLPLIYGLSAGTVAGLVWGTRAFAELATCVNLLEEQRRATLLVARHPSEAPVAPSNRRLDHPCGRLDDTTTRTIVRRLLLDVAGRGDLRGGTL